jgi:LuxR family maltose regulon positive regulatory protein
MPRRADVEVLWVEAEHSYAIHDRRRKTGRPADPEEWQALLGRQRSFAFAGRAGRLTLLKEARAGGDGYWYAYRRQDSRTVKRYAGRSAELTIARLEELAEILNPQAALAASQRFDALLLSPKLQLPRLHAAYVPRERLLAALDAAGQHSMTLLCAPAGYGKTTLVRSWLERQASVRVGCWVALDARDNDPIRFWRYVIAA